MVVHFINTFIHKKLYVPVTEIHIITTVMTFSFYYAIMIIFVFVCVWYQLLTLFYRMSSKWQLFIKIFTSCRTKPLYS